jgi:hypothetical protein
LLCVFGPFLAGKWRHADIGFDGHLRVNQFKSSPIQNQGDMPAARIETPLSGAIASYRQMAGMVDIGSATQGTG